MRLSFLCRPTPTTRRLFFGLAAIAAPTASSDPHPTPPLVPRVLPTPWCVSHSSFYNSIDVLSISCLASIPLRLTLHERAKALVTGEHETWRHANPRPTYPLPACLPYLIPLSPPRTLRFPFSRFLVVDAPEAGNAERANIILYEDTAKYWPTEVRAKWAKAERKCLARLYMPV